MSQNNIQEYLKTIQLSEGERFTFDEDGINKEYELLEANKSSIGIKILSIFGGIMASIAFIGFLFISNLYQSELTLLMLGIVLISSAIWLNKKYAKIIIDTLCISAYIIGCFLLMVGLNEMDVDENIIAVFLIVMALATLLINQSYMLSFLSVLIISASFLFLIIENEVYNLIHVYNAVLLIAVSFWFLKEAKIISTHPKLSKLYFPVRIGLIFSLLFGLISIGKRELIELPPEHIWFSSIITIPLALYVINKVLIAVGVKKNIIKIVFLGASLLFLLPSSLSPAISGAFLLMLLSFLVNYKTSFIISIAAFIYFVSQYYYDLTFTLLTKSIVLFFSGLVFLFLFLFTYKKLQTEETVLSGGEKQDTDVNV